MPLRAKHHSYSLYFARRLQTLRAKPPRLAVCMSLTLALNLALSLPLLHSPIAPHRFNSLPSIRIPQHQ